MHDVACEFARAVVRSKDAQKQLARTSLNISGCPLLEKLGVGVRHRLSSDVIKTTIHVIVCRIT